MLRSMLNRILTVLYVRVSGGERLLQLEPEAKACGEQSVANLVSLHQSGLLSREEARGILSDVYGRELA